MTNILRQLSCFHQNWYRKYDMRRGVQVSFGERNPTRDTGTVQSVCGLCILLLDFFFSREYFEVFSRHDKCVSHR